MRSSVEEARPRLRQLALGTLAVVLICMFCVVCAGVGLGLALLGAF